MLCWLLATIIGLPPGDQYVVLEFLDVKHDLPSRCSMIDVTIDGPRNAEVLMLIEVKE